MKKIGIIGAGAWGTALGQIFAQHGHDVKLWARRTYAVERINMARENASLPGIRIHDRIVATDRFDDLADCPILIYALPAQILREFLTTHKIADDQIVVITAKGIEIASGLPLSHVARDIQPNVRVGILTGPNFAREVANGLPAASTIASDDPDVLAILQQELSTKTFRLYPTNDMIGASCGGALKNVIAIACGVVDGLKLGDNARAALITRGLAEIARLTEGLGGNRETLMGLCGMGDLILSCTSTQSRNYRFGLALADSEIHEISSDTTIEGVSTAQAIIPLAGKLHIEMPICVAVAACLNGQMSVQQAVGALLQRPSRTAENE